MSDNKPDYRIVVSEEYKTSNGEVKNYYTEVGRGWKLKGGGISARLREGLSVSGGFAIFPATDRAAQDGPTPSDELDDGIPL